jgi:hypothetical protein
MSTMNTDSECVVTIQDSNGNAVAAGVNVMQALHEGTATIKNVEWRPKGVHTTSSIIVAHVKSADQAMTVLPEQVVEAIAGICRFPAPGHKVEIEFVEMTMTEFDSLSQQS